LGWEKRKGGKRVQTKKRTGKEVPYMSPVEKMGLRLPRFSKGKKGGEKKGGASHARKGENLTAISINSGGGKKEGAGKFSQASEGKEKGRGWGWGETNTPETGIFASSRRTKEEEEGEGGPAFLIPRSSEKEKKKNGGRKAQGKGD